MHYPVITEKQLATRWNVSVKTLRRWREAKIGPVYRKLWRLIRYFEEDIQEFERENARHWTTWLDRDEDDPIVFAPAGQAVCEEKQDGIGLVSVVYVTAKEAAEITDLPLHLFADRNERDRKRIPYISLVGNVRFSLDEVYRWESANAVPAFGPDAPQVSAAAPIETPQPERVPRWYELVQEQTE